MRFLWLSLPPSHPFCPRISAGPCSFHEDVKNDPRDWEGCWEAAGKRSGPKLGAHVQCPHEPSWQPYCGCLWLGTQQLTHWPRMQATWTLEQVTNALRASRGLLMPAACQRLHLLRPTMGPPTPRTPGEGERRGIHPGRWSQPCYRTQDCQARAPHPSPRVPGAVSEPFNTSTLTPWGGQHPARPQGQGPKSYHSDLSIIVTPPLAALCRPLARSPVLARGAPGHPDNSPSQIPTSVPSAKSLLPQG